MKHSFSIILISTLLLAGCGSSSDSKSNSQPTSPSTPQQQTPQEENTGEQTFSDASEIPRNGCLIENMGNIHFPVQFPMTVRLNVAELNENSRFPFLPIFHVRNTPITLANQFVVLGPMQDEEYKKLRDWQWVVSSISNDSVVFKKVYFTQNAITVVEGPQLEFTEFNQPIHFNDVDTKLRFHCLLIK